MNQAQGNLRMNGVTNHVTNRPSYVSKENKLRTPILEPEYKRKKPESGGINNFVGARGRTR